MKTGDKVRSLLGFSVKAGKVIFGIDNPLIGKKRIYLALMCGSASENTKERVKKFVKAKGIPLIETKKALDETLNKNCKVVMITDRQLAQAIIVHANEDYLTHGGESI